MAGGDAAALPSANKAIASANGRQDAAPGDRVERAILSIVIRSDVFTQSPRLAMSDYCPPALV
jgi:hypothetical protein